MSEEVKSYSESMPTAFASPDNVLASMDRLGMSDTGARCEVRCAEIIWKEREEKREAYYIVGEPHACGGRIFFSKTQNKKLTCGLCAARGVDCVNAVVKLLWRGMWLDQSGTPALRELTNKIIIYSGFEKSQKFIYEKAEVKFKYQYEEFLAEKARREKAEREKEERKKKLRMKL